VANFEEQLIHQLGRRANNLFELAVAKGIAAGALGLNHTVGVKEKAVAWVDGQVANGIVGALGSSSCHSGIIDGKDILLVESGPAASVCCDPSLGLAGLPQVACG
jgi:hypothetical protein